jgi:hypothetical protein
VNRQILAAVAACASISIAAPAAAATPRELLMSAAFGSPDKATALARIEAGLKAADALLARNKGDREAQLQRAVAISYRGKLKRNRADLLTARRELEALVAANPGNAEAQAALGGWHLGAVTNVGAMVARTALGARKLVGLKALDRSVALSGGRAFFPAFASLTRIMLDPADVAGARRLAEAAVKARVDGPMDRIMQARASTLLKALSTGDGKAAAKTAKTLMPFGRFG